MIKSFTVHKHMTSWDIQCSFRVFKNNIFELSKLLRSTFKCGIEKPLLLFINRDRLQFVQHNTTLLYYTYDLFLIGKIKCIEYFRKGACPSF